MKRQAIIAALTVILGVAPFAASAQPMGGMYVHRGQPITRMGQIASTSGGSFKLYDGTTVFLNHTTINPTGIQLHPGQRVQIQGYGSGHGAINAQTVNVMRHHMGM